MQRCAGASKGEDGETNAAEAMEGPPTKRARVEAGGGAGRQGKQVFISHPGNGSVKALCAMPLSRYLAKLGVTNFVDHRHLEPGMAADKERDFQ